MPLGNLIDKKRAELDDKLGQLKEELTEKKEQIEKKVDEAVNSEIAQAAASKVKDVTEKVEEVGGRLKEKLQLELEDAKKKIEEWIEKIKKQAEDWIEERKAELTAWIERVKDHIHLWILERVEEKLDQGLDKLLPKIKNSAKDPYMPMVLQNAVDNIIDAIWFDLKEEIIEIAVCKFRPPIQTSILTKNTTCCGLVRYLRYSLYPYDKSTWQSFRNPIFVLFRVICLIPFPGVLQLMWFMVLLIIDKGDEFQLLQYIISFKGMQFLTLGVIKSIIGFTILFMCSTREDDITVSGLTIQRQDSCEDAWTISRIDSFGLAFLMLQVVIVWVAFSFIPSSKQKGSYHLLLKEDHERRNIKMEEGVYIASTLESRKAKAIDQSDMPLLGHRTMKWLIYDMIVFSICVILGLVAMFAHANPRARVIGDDREGGMVTNWRFTATLYWLQALYGIASVPFLIFCVPLLSSLFTHAKPTGYDQDGNCVPYVGMPAEIREERRRLVSELTEAANCQAEEREKRAATTDLIPFRQFMIPE